MSRCLELQRICKHCIRFSCGTKSATQVLALIIFGPDALVGRDSSHRCDACACARGSHLASDTHETNLERSSCVPMCAKGLADCAHNLPCIFKLEIGLFASFCSFNLPSLLPLQKSTRLFKTPPQQARARKAAPSSDKRRHRSSLANRSTISACGTLKLIAAESKNSTLELWIRCASAHSIILLASASLKRTTKLRSASICGAQMLRLISSQATALNGYARA